MEYWTTMSPSSEAKPVRHTSTLNIDYEKHPDHPGVSDDATV